MRTAKEIRTEAKDRRAAYQLHKDWDVPALKKELAELRERELPKIEKWAEGLVADVDKLLKTGVIGGKHWGRGLSTKEVWAKARKLVTVHHLLKVTRIDVDLPDFEDYPVVSIQFSYDEKFVRPFFDLEELRSLFDFENATKVSLDFEHRGCGSPGVYVVGTYAGRFCHINLALTNKVALTNKDE
jgi:hypothetical protein